MNEVGTPASMPGEQPAVTLPIRDWPVRIGGLMRCCTETLRVDAGWAKEGQVLACLYCSHSMRLRDGAWEWNRPTLPPPNPLVGFVACECGGSHDFRDHPETPAGNNEADDA